MKRAIFIDQDGVLLPDVAHSPDPEQIMLPLLTARGLRLLQQRDYALFLLSSQSDLAHGLLSEDALQQLGQHIDALLAREKVHLDGFYFCPHDPNGNNPAYAIDCDCRRPQPGLIRRAAADHMIDLAHSWMIGDVPVHMESGRRAGCKTVLISSGSNLQWQPPPRRLPHLITFNLYRAAEAILLADAPR